VPLTSSKPPFPRAEPTLNFQLFLELSDLVFFFLIKQAYSSALNFLPPESLSRFLHSSFVPFRESTSSCWEDWPASLTGPALLSSNPPRLSNIPNRQFFASRSLNGLFARRREPVAIGVSFLASCSRSVRLRSSKRLHPKAPPPSVGSRYKRGFPWSSCVSLSLFNLRNIYDFDHE